MLINPLFLWKTARLDTSRLLNYTCHIPKFLTNQNMFHTKAGALFVPLALNVLALWASCTFRIAKQEVKSTSVGTV